MLRKNLFTFVLLLSVCWYFGPAAIAQDASIETSNNISTNNNIRPTAVISATPSGGPAPLTVNLDAGSSYDPDGTIVEWRWHLGDGTKLDYGQITHVYYKPGLYNVKLKVRDNSGDWSHYAMLKIKVTGERADLGGMNVDSSPTGAEIWFDGENTSHITPYIFSNLPPGFYTVTCKMNGYQESSKIVNIVAGHIKKVKFELEEAPESEMVVIPAGIFEMGDNLNVGENDEYPVHTVYVPTFEIDQKEVTNTSYAECVAVGICPPPNMNSSETRISYYDNSTYGNYPVIHVSWFNAKQYCEWKSKRLPTEAEWEYASRGGNVGFKYPNGDTLTGSDANYYNSGDAEDNDTNAVGQYPANGYGLYDMAGNVYEWINDWYEEGYYNDSPVYKPLGPASSSSSRRSLRGGSWAHNPPDLRVADRGARDPYTRQHNYGFRCARSVVDNSDMVDIPAGCFDMGNHFDDNGNANEKPVHPVCISAFKMHKYLVTNAKYKLCVDAGNCTPPWSTGSHTRSTYYGDLAFDNYPVIYLSFNSAKQYCIANGMRLPTEAEWEYAARGGLEGQKYPWGNEIYPYYANYEGTDTSMVGFYPPNEFGLFDMAGNVYERVEDFFGNYVYTDEPVQDPTGPTSGSWRVIRGGNWGTAWSQRVSYRPYKVPGVSSYPHIGFRCVMDQ